ncbi:MAG: GNAT family N-acyltransferase [Gammaproteobacteria bacterium]
MLQTVRSESIFQSQAPAELGHQLHVALTRKPEDIRAAQRLRYQVFVEEMGAGTGDAVSRIEQDEFDPYCIHLLVRDAAHHNQVVGCYRILTGDEAARAGSYYSQTEFDLGRILGLPGRFMEVGRTCVHPDYRNGATVSLLWQGLARFMMTHKFDYLMGCASIPLDKGMDYITALYAALNEQHSSPPEQRVYPHLPLFNSMPHHVAGPVPIAIPALLNAYLRMGAVVCGEPAWDPQFNVADLFILLAARRIHTRYARHFIERVDRAA